jgi:hypothetical protein
MTGLTLEDNLACDRKILFVHQALYAPFLETLLGPLTLISRFKVGAQALRSFNVQSHRLQPVAWMIIPTTNEYVEKELGTDLEHNGVAVLLHDAAPVLVAEYSSETFYTL